jgi:aspartyl-tRNA(Asn)/glutamyl-tRNA(Gln) amidotransferase subunit B
VLVLADNRDIAAFYDGSLSAGADAKTAANWIMGDILAHLKEQKVGIADVKLTPGALAELLAHIKAGAISGKVRFAFPLWRSHTHMPHTLGC